MSGAERQIAEDVASLAGMTVARLGLRFDKVVTRVLGDLTAFAERTTPAGMTVLVTISAPIRRPAKTVEALERDISALLSRGAAGPDTSAVHWGNSVRLRLARHARARAHPLIGFVHNPGVAADRLLDLAQAWLRADP